MTFRKGDRVKTKLKNSETVHAVVVKGGTRIKAVVYGGESQVTGPASAFSPSDRPLPISAPSVMDKWGLAGYEECSGRGGLTAFHAEITLNGSKAGTVRNSGDGSANSTYFTQSEVRKQFLNDCRAWAEQFGYPDMIEPDSAWIDWYVNEKAYGVTADTYVKSLKCQMDQLLGHD